MKAPQPPHDHRHVSEKHGRLRPAIAVVLVVLFAVLVPVTATIAWMHRTVLDTDTYVSTVAPVASDPRVIAAASRDITNQLYATLDVPAKVADVLPAKAQILSVPIANGARDYVEQAVTRVLASDEFQQLWESSNRFAHAQLVSVLRGDSSVLAATGGAVVLNLVPLLNEALRNMQTFVSGIVGHAVALPTLTGQELPAVACARLSAALDRPLPTTCGVITLFRAKNLEAAQRAVRAFDRGTVALLIITPLVGIGALAASTRRRRTLLQLAVATAVALVVVRRVVMWTKNDLVTVGRPENKGAREAIVDQVLSGFFDVTLWLLLAALVITVVGLVTGPYRWAVRSRAVGRQTVDGVQAAFVGHANGGRSEEAVAWADGHFNVLRLGAIAVAVLLVATVDVDVVGFLVIAGVLAMFEVGLYRLRTSAHPPGRPAVATTRPGGPTPRI
jgi:hypothetical protein